MCLTDYNKKLKYWLISNTQELLKYYVLESKIDKATHKFLGSEPDAGNADNTTGRHEEFEDVEIEQEESNDEEELTEGLPDLQVCKYGS